MSCGPDIEKPSVKTNDVTSITDTTAKVICELTEDGGSDETSRGVCYNTNGNPTTENDMNVSGGTGVGIYECELYGLTPNTTYYVKAYATNEVGTSYGEELVFKTEESNDNDDNGDDDNGDDNNGDDDNGDDDNGDDDNGDGNDDEEITLPTATTKEVTEITFSSAVCGGNIASDGGAEITARGVCWSTTAEPTIEDAHTTDGEGTGEFSSNITELTENTTYYVRAYATNEIGTSYGEEKVFKTDVIEDIVTLPNVSTKPATDITYTSAVCGGNVTSDGGAEVTARGICWGTTTEPTINDSHTSDGNGTGDFSSSINGLSENTTYYVRAYATNEKGTSYGETESFTTMGISLPTIITSEVTDVKYTSAVCGGNVTSDGGTEVTERGICWSTNAEPTINDDHTTAGNGTGTFSSNINDLSENTTYYVRAYATNEKGTNYGEVKSFKTLGPSTGTIDGHDYIDLGLPSGLKWATCNIGANTPEEYGDYYAWAEIVTKDTYDFMNNTSFTLQISDIAGNEEYDAATANWSKSWRMPRLEDFTELNMYCSWEFTSSNGVVGYIVTGPNGNQIFLPASGFRLFDEHNGTESVGYYWSSTAHEDINITYPYAYGLYCNFSSHNTHYNNRFIGQPIRPVVNKQN